MSDDEPKAIIVITDGDDDKDGVRKHEGRRKSGRFWKAEVRPPASKQRKGHVYHTTWKQKQEKRAEMNRIREMERMRQQEMEEAREEERQKRLERKRRREYNEKRAEQTQELNPKRLRQKLKTMSKKQKRMIRKTTADPLPSK